MNQQLQEKCLKEQLEDPGVIKGFFGEYSFLSNFHLCSVYYEGLTYPSSENAFQAAKFDPATREIFLSLSPSESKRFGKVLKIKDIAIWENTKNTVMYRILLSKFSENKELRAKLVNTNPKKLQETNWWGDKYWGVCDGVGENALGNILMAVRLILI